MKTRGRAADKHRSRGERDTASLLVEAAAKEFQEHGFGGTDTNRIARRAGFAPQTFYRWFEDKTAIFLAVYRDWVATEFDEIDRLRAKGASEVELADAVIAHHRAYYIFRRSLRQLTVEDDRVRGRARRAAWSRSRESRPATRHHALPARMSPSFFCSLNVFATLLRMESCAISGLRRTLCGNTSCGYMRNCAGGADSSGAIKPTIPL
jgi:AcrR family transcriptional regulator